MYRRPLPALTGLLFTVLAVVAHGEQFERYGNLEVHYNVFNSTSISAAMSERYELKRGEDIAYVNVAGRRREDDGTTRAVKLALEGEVANLLGQTRPLEFLLVEEPGAVYYILTTRFSDRETLRFRLQVTDTESGRSYPMEFQKELWKQ